MDRPNKRNPQRDSVPTNKRKKRQRTILDYRFEFPVAYKGASIVDVLPAEILVYILEFLFHPSDLVRGSTSSDHAFRWRTLRMVCKTFRGAIESSDLSVFVSIGGFYGTDRSQLRTKEMESLPSECLILLSSLLERSLVYGENGMRSICKDGTLNMRVAYHWTRGLLLDAPPGCQDDDPPSASSREEGAIGILEGIRGDELVLLQSVLLQSKKHSTLAEFIPISPSVLLSGDLRNPTIMLRWVKEHPHDAIPISHFMQECAYDALVHHALHCSLEERGDAYVQELGICILRIEQMEEHVEECISAMKRILSRLIDVPRALTALSARSVTFLRMVLKGKLCIQPMTALLASTSESVATELLLAPRYKTLFSINIQSIFTHSARKGYANIVGGLLNYRKLDVHHRRSEAFNEAVLLGREDVMQKFAESDRFDFGRVKKGILEESRRRCTFHNIMNAVARSEKYDYTVPLLREFHGEGAIVDRT